MNIAIIILGLAVLALLIVVLRLNSKRHTGSVIDPALLQTLTKEDLDRQLEKFRSNITESLTDKVSTAAAEKATDASKNILESEQRLIDEKLEGSKSFSENRDKALAEQMKSISDALDKTQKAVETSAKERGQQFGELGEGLNSARELYQKLQQNTADLTNALSNPSARGQWGERMAEDVLNLAGFIEGINYEKQKQLQGESQNRPDFTFKLPEGKVLNMDVKFSLDNYLKALQCEQGSPDFDSYANQYCKDVKTQIKEVAGKEYINPPETVDNVLIFIPNEAAYSFLVERDNSIMDFAMGHKTILCSPFTIFAVLAVIRESMSSYHLQQSANEILSVLVGVRKEWGKFSEAVEKVGRGLSTAQNAYDNLATTRTNVIERQLQRIEILEKSRIESGEMPLIENPDSESPEFATSNESQNGAYKIHEAEIVEE